MLVAPLRDQKWLCGASRQQDPDKTAKKDFMSSVWKINSKELLVILVMVILVVPM